MHILFSGKLWQQGFNIENYIFDSVKQNQKSFLNPAFLILM